MIYHDGLRVGSEQRSEKKVKEMIIQPIALNHFL